MKSMIAVIILPGNFNQLPTVGVEVKIIQPKFQANHYTKICILSFLSHFWKQFKDPVWMLASTNQQSEEYPHSSCNKLAWEAKLSF
jgi:hypothetical protein